MFEKFLSGNVENFKQRYEGTFGFYRDERRNRLLVKIQEISADQCNFITARGVTYNVRPDHPDDVGFEFIPPKSLWYNTVFGPVFVQRLAQRQWQRGVCSKNLEALQLREGQLHPRRIDFATLSAIYENPVDVKEAFSLMGDRGGLAISGQFALDDRGVVRVLKEVIGTYTRNRAAFKFKLHEPQLWKTEITDALNVIGCSSEIS